MLTFQIILQRVKACPLQMEAFLIIFTMILNDFYLLKSEKSQETNDFHFPLEEKVDISFINIKSPQWPKDSIILEKYFSSFPESCISFSHPCLPWIETF